MAIELDKFVIGFNLAVTGFHKKGFASICRAVLMEEELFSSKRSAKTDCYLDRRNDIFISKQNLFFYLDISYMQNPLVLPQVV